MHAVFSAIDHRAERPPGLLIEGDSRLVVEQLVGKWAANKPDLRRLRNLIRDALAVLGVPWAARWIPREENAEADELTRPETPVVDEAFDGPPEVAKEPEPAPPPPPDQLEQMQKLGLRLYVVGEASGDPATWDEDGTRNFVFATSAAEALALAKAEASLPAWATDVAEVVVTGATWLAEERPQEPCGWCGDGL